MGPRSVRHAVGDSSITPSSNQVRSVGYHRHDTVQECYLILAGNGVMKVDGTVFGVAPGTGIPNRLGGAHGIAARDEMVEFINIALFTEGRFDAVDLGDDLSNCL